MSLRWLSGMVGGRRIARPGVRRRMAPLAQRDLAAEIDADAVPVERVWARSVVRDPEHGAARERTVIAWIAAGARPDVRAWLDGAAGGEAAPHVRTDWIFLPAAPEAILIGVVEDVAGEPVFRFNLRFSADRYRRYLEVLSGTGLLGLTTGPLLLGPERQLESPCAFVEVPTRPLRDFLRELPPVPVV